MSYRELADLLDAIENSERQGDLDEARRLVLQALSVLDRLEDT